MAQRILGVSLRLTTNWNNAELHSQFLFNNELNGRKIDGRQMMGIQKYD